MLRTSKETTGDIACCFSTTALVDDVRDGPASDGHLDTNVDQRKECDEVHGLATQDLPELAMLTGALLPRLIANLFEAVYSALSAHI